MTNFPKNEHFLPPDTHTCVVLTDIFSNSFVITFLTGSKEQWVPKVLAQGSKWYKEYLRGLCLFASPASEGTPKIQKTDKAKITSGLYLAILSRNHFVSEKSFNKKGAKWRELRPRTSWLRFSCFGLKCQWFFIMYSASHQLNSTYFFK